jgi:inorganic pyrophosphatase/exopolyphosphatase
VGYFLTQKIKQLYVIVFGGESAEMQKQRARILAKNNVCMIPVIDSFSHIFAINNALKNADLVSMAGDRVYEGSQFLVVSDDESKIENAFNTKLVNHEMWVDGILSRKKQVIPVMEKQF